LGLEGVRPDRARAFAADNEVSGRRIERPELIPAGADPWFERSARACAETAFSFNTPINHGRDPTMDLGLKGKKAIVCAASKGLGKACAMSLAREGVEVFITARTASDLEATAAEIRAATGSKVTAVPGDITTEAGRAAVLAACPDPDILVNNAGGPPRGDFRDWDRDDWLGAIDANMLAPIFMIKAVVDGMIERKFGRIVNITSASVKSPIPELGMSNGARAGLTGFVAGLARQIAKNNVVINNILPGPFLTDRLRGGFQEAARASNRPVDELVQERAKGSPTGRVGDPAEFGDACAFLCSAKIGFIVGHNLILDGGNFNSSIA
jgi:3-oxoacyl-[acyl-carrier protein] reductase